MLVICEDTFFNREKYLMIETIYINLCLILFVYLCQQFSGNNEVQETSFS